VDRANESAPQSYATSSNADEALVGVSPEALSVHVERREVGEAKRAYWYATIEGETFRVGRDVSYPGGRRGLQSASEPNCIRYNADDWRDEFGVWADMLGATAFVEGGCDLCTINTYDGVQFTFGLMQWGAHTPDANFVLLFRRLLARPEAGSYFPDLVLEGGRIARRAPGGNEQLESSLSTAALQNYLNPDPDQVGEAEVTAAAKLKHWIRHEPEAQAALIRFAFESYLDLLKKEVDPKVGLDDKTDIEVMLCLDIRHQGRAKKYDEVRSALKNERSVAELLKIGDSMTPDPKEDP